MAESNLVCLRSKIFPKVFVQNTANNKNCHYRTHSVKINDQFFFKFEKPYFWPISSIFGAKKVFPKNWAVMQNFLRVSSTMLKKIQRNLMIQSKKTPADDRKDGQTLFHRILPATPRSLTSTTAVDWHLKVRDIE